MKRIYCVGGSPCSGKSTVAQAIAERHKLRYYNVDQDLETFIALAAKTGRPSCAAVCGMSPEQIWMRSPDEQNREELNIYREIFCYVKERLFELEGDIVTEGAAYLPELSAEAGFTRYLCLTPTRDFQISRYRERPWISMVLEGCTNQKKAFANWMERDALFAEEVRRQCAVLGCASLVNDGSLGVEALIQQVCALLGLSELT